MTRPTRVIIDPRAAAHNLSLARRAAPSCRVMAVIKADAYGHGICRMARALDGVDAFAVASLEEALILKDAGIAKPIVLLEGPFEAAEVPTIVELGLELVCKKLFVVRSRHAVACCGIIKFLLVILLV